MNRPRLFLAVAFVFYNGSSLVNLNINTVGFYQISKILVTPAVSRDREAVSTLATVKK